ncbi:MAG TPA: protease pro-enzyme activation domain-containing protein [Solirubrobacteraceae bacterium]|nr:protease pro-enzyme activation domain-containing protein [Solirubrobacteraceae bacterium]
MAGGSRTTLRLVGALAVAALAPASASAAALVRVGPATVTPAFATRTPSRPLATATRMRVTIALRPRDPAALATYAQAVATPGSPDFRRYLTPAQFARRFGPTAAQVSSVRTALRAAGLDPGPLSRGALSMSVSASAGGLERAFSVSLNQLTIHGERTAIEASARPAVAAGAAGAIQSIVGLDTTAAPRPLLVRDSASAARAPLAAAHVATGGPQPCARASSAAPGQSAYTADEIASAYGFSGLYRGGDQGAGVTVAVYELEPDDSSDIAAYQSCYGTHAQITNVPVDGGTGSGAGSGEAALDIENLIGLDPDATVLVYQGPNSDSGNPGSGPYDTFSAIVNQDRARVVTVSWGQCEAALGRADALAESTLFAQATVQGQTIVAASGDNGAEDCDIAGTLPQTQAAVDDPSSQPFVTGVGGTTLSSLGPRPVESVWNSGGSPVTGLVPPGAGGGGISNFWPMPPAQLDAAASLGLRSPLAAGSACGNGAGYCREVPDVSADADPTTGYLVYWNGSGSVPDQPQGWQGIGGTSGAAPLWAAVIALADASKACSTPIGYADPALYRAAGSAYAADFNDVTSGDNDFTGTNGGRYAATAGYDPVTGLGTPNAASLAASLCTATARISDPGIQRSTVHTAVSLALHGSDTAGTGVTYGASGLPPGLKVNGSTGRITGHPSRAGTWTVHVRAADAQDSTAVAAFTWYVGAVPKVSHLSLAPGPVLTFVIASARNAPQLRTIALTVPADLHLGSRRGVGVSTTARKPARVRFIDHISGGRTVTIALRKVTGSISVRLAPPALSVRRGRVAHLTVPGGRQQLRLSVTDAAGGRTSETSRVIAK